jgi:hypothetical protein
MPDDLGNHQARGSDYGGQLREALDRLRGLVVDGLKHGFFDYSISCEVGSKGKRQLVIRAGKSHKFTIPEDDLPR